MDTAHPALLGVWEQQRRGMLFKSASLRLMELRRSRCLYEGKRNEFNVYIALCV